MAVVFKNNAKTTLASGITSSATSITVADGSVFPTLTGSDTFFCTLDDGTNIEIVEVTAVSSNTLTVTRAQDNTSATSFSTGTVAELRLTAGILNLFSQTGSDINAEVEAYLDANGLTLPDDVKAQFGTGNDLQIYHASGESYVEDVGAGDLSLRTNGNRVLIATTSGETMGRFEANSYVKLYYDNSPKLATTSTGIDVTGTIESTGFISVEGTSGNTGAGTDRWIGGDGTAGTWFYNVPTGSNHYFAVNNSNTLGINSTGINVTGTISSGNITVNNKIIASGDSDTYLQFNDADTFRIVTGDTNRLLINSSGDVQVGATAPQTNANFNLRRNGANIEFGHNNRTSGYYGTLGAFYNNGQPYLGFSADANDSGNTFNTRGFRGNLIYGNTSGDLIFAQLTNANATGQTPTTRLTINSSGNATFAGQIHFSGSSSLRSNNPITFNTIGGAAQTGLFKSVAAQTSYANSASDGMFNALNGYAVGTGTGQTVIDGSRNITAGTISSGAITVTSTVAGTTASTFSGNYSASGDVKLAVFERSGGAVASAIEYNDATTDMEFGTTTSHSFSLKTADTRRLTIDSSGNSTFAGDITLSGANDDLIFTDKSSVIQFGSAGTNTTWSAPKIWRSSTNYISIADYSGVELGGYNGTAYGARLRVEGNGDVNIIEGSLEIAGTTVIDSSRNLTNIGNLSTSGFVTIDSTTDSKLKLKTPSGESSDWNYIEFYGADDTRDGYVGTDADGDMKFFSDKNSSELRLESSGATISTDLTVTGDLTVNGTTTTVNQTNLDVSDNLIGLNRGASSNANDSGMLIERGSTGDNVFIGWDESTDKITFATTTNVPSDTGNLTLTAAPIQASSVGVTNIVTNKVVKFDGSILDDSNITDTGSLITLGSDSSIASGSLYADAQDNWVGINTTSDIGSVLNVLDVDGASVTLRLHTNTNSHNPVLRMNARNSSGTQQYADIKYNPDSPSFNFHVPYNESTPTLKIADGSVTVDGTISSGAITSSGNIVNDIGNSGDDSYIELKNTGYTGNVTSLRQNADSTRAELNSSERSIYVQAGENSSSNSAEFRVYTNTVQALTLDASQNATFAGTIDSGAITAPTLNTGQGANELYAMNQNVRTSDSPSFNALTIDSTSSTHNLYLDNRDDFIDSTSHAAIWITSGGTGFKSGAGAHLVFEGRRSTRNFYFKVGDVTAPQHIMHSNGYVGIATGDITPSSTLQVNGTISSGAITSSDISNFQRDIRSAGQIRATGWYGDAASTDYTGMALEIGVSGSAPHILAYNRSTQSYGQLQTYAAGMTFDSRSNAFTITNSSHVQSDSDIRAAGSRVRIGNPTGLPGRSSIRIDTTGDAAADIVFGDNTSSTSWSNANWTLSSRSTSDNQVFRIYRGSGQPSPYNSEAVAVEIARDLNMTLGKGLVLGSSSTLSIPSHSGIEIDITGSTSGNIRANNDFYLLSQNGTLNLGAGGTNSQISLATNGNATFAGNISISKNNPVLMLSDTSSASNADQVAYISFQDNGTEEAWIGWGSQGNTDLTIKNNIGSVVLDGTGTTVINDNLDLNGNADISGTATFSGLADFDSGITVSVGGSDRLSIAGGDVDVVGATDLQIRGTSRRLSFTAGTGTVRTTTANSLILQTNSTTALTLDSSQNSTFAGTVDTPKVNTNELVRSNSRVSSSHDYPVGHYSKGDQVFAIDPTWSESELRSFFNSTSVSWSAQSDAPGGYAVYINGSVDVGGVYGAGFGHIPIETGDLFYMECWIKNVGENRHYMGSNEFNENFGNVGGNPGSFGYWVMSNTNPGSSWVKVSGYISNVSGTGTTTGQFDNGAKYWTPMALFNYVNTSGTRACYISGWKVYRVNRGSPQWIIQSNRQDVTAANTIASYTGSVGSGWAPMALFDNNTKPGHPLVIKNSRSDYWSVGIDTHSYGIYARAYSANTRSILQGTDTAGNVVFDAGFDGDLAIGGDISMAGLYAGTWGPSSSSSVGRIGQVTDRVAGSITNQIGGSTSAKWEIVDYGWSAVLMQCDNSGNTYIGGSLGIGTGADTSHSLKISSNDNEPVEIFSSAGGCWINTQSSGSQVMSMGADSNGWAIYDRTNSAYRIRVANNGQLQTFQGIANSSSYSQTGGTFSTVGASTVTLTDGYERVKINGYDFLGYGAGGNGLWVISNVTANASNQSTLTLGTEWDWDDSLSFKYVPAASGSSGGVLTIGQDQKNSPSWNHNTTNFNFNGSTIFQFANTSRFEMRPTSSSGGERVYYAAGSYTANTSATFQDVRMIGTLPVDHKYVRDSSGNYGYKMEYWWDGNSYQNIRQENDAFRFSTDVIAFDTSDKRLKNNITPIENCLDKVSKLGAYEFEWDETKQRRFKGFDTGVIAQEVEEVYPHMVETREDGYKALQYEKLVPLLLGAIKEQQEQIESLKSEVDNLKGEK